MSTQVTVITVGGDRPECLALLEKYVSRQTVQDFAWLLVDDSQEPMQPTLGQDVIRLPYESSPRESFRKNMMVALTQVKTPGVVIAEIDDWIAPGYIEEQSEILQYKELSGRSKAKYFHVASRAYFVHPNTAHCSLCQTAFSGPKVRTAMLEYLGKDRRPEQLDGYIWKRAGLTDKSKSIIPGGTMTVGMKAMPGRGGLGIHHRLEEVVAAGYTPDLDLVQLRRWIGEDYLNYLPFHTPETQPSSSGD